jgi:hypothetical protein
VKRKDLLDESKTDVMLHLGLLKRGVARLLQVLVREAPVVDVKNMKGHKKLKEYPPLTVTDLQFLDDEFKRLISDATASRVRLHQVITLMRLDQRSRKIR